jgi:hypothetical protein
VQGPRSRRLPGAPDISIYKVSLTLKKVDRQTDLESRIIKKEYSKIDIYPDAVKPTKAG